jgi:folate-binding protein YgfZ
VNALLLQARAHGFALPAGQIGMALPGMIEADGPDAARFLHSQLTQEIEALEPGQGAGAGRVSRSGQTLALMTVHRLDDEGESQRFRLAAERELVAPLIATLDGFLFSDRLSLVDVSDRYVWWFVEGPHAAEVLDGVFGPVGFEPWSTLPEGACRALRRAKGGLPSPEGSLALRKTTGGDPGFLLALAPSAAPALALALRDGARAQGMVVDADPDALIEALRLEAGLVRVLADMPGKARLLPELGVESFTVSYTKGCYLGQEIIARVRTYGSVPNALRGLQFPDDPDALGRLPEVGAPVVLEDGTTAGQWSSRGWSPTWQGALAWAFLPRDRRTPGQKLRLNDRFGDPLEAVVALLPVHRSRDQAERVAWLYDRAVRRFAGGDIDSAILDLDGALRLDPGHSDSYETLGVILGRTGRFHEAIDLFRRLEEVAPDEPLVNTNLSLWSMKMGDKEAAEAEAARATLKQMRRQAKKQGADPGAVVQDEQKSKVNEARRKEGMFRKVLEIDEVDPIALFGLGQALLVQGRMDEAAEILGRGVAASANQSAMWLAYGKALEGISAWDRAVEAYGRGIEVASKRGDLQPLREMEHRRLLVSGSLNR